MSAGRRPRRRPARSTPWGRAVKDVSVTASPWMLAGRIRRFTGPGGYVSLLLCSLREVTASAVAVARLLGVPGHRCDRQVLPLVITGLVEPAVFARIPKSSS